MIASAYTYGSCAAHESFGDRLSSTVAACMRQAVEEILTAHPGIAMELGRSLGPQDGFPNPVEAAVFLPGVWAKWADAVGVAVSAVQDELLTELALLGGQAAEPRVDLGE